MGKHSMGDEPFITSYKSIRGERSDTVGSQSMSYPDSIVSVPTGETVDGMGPTVQLISTHGDDQSGYEKE
jgi:hypothetical protein